MSSDVATVVGDAGAYVPANAHTDWWRLPIQAVRRCWRGFSGLSLMLVVTYYAALVGVMTLRLGQLPNYAEIYDAPAAYMLIWTSTPSPLDAVQIMADEPLFEIGYKMPEFGISEWSLMVALPNLIQVSAGAALLAVFFLLGRLARRAGCALRLRAVAAAGAGAGLLALCSASLTWVVCCATPSWVVALSLLGVSLTLAQWLGPFDALFLCAGGLAAACGIALQARRLAQRGGLPPAPIRQADSVGSDSGGLVWR